MSKAWQIIKWVVGVGAILALVVGGAAVMLYPKIKQQMENAKKSGQGDLVRLETIAAGELVRTISAPGYLEAVRFVNISARFSAQIVELPFEEGDFVKEGDLMVKLDDRDLQAQLSASGAIHRAEEARLDGARATLVNAVAEWERQSALAASNDVSKSLLDQAEADRRRAEASLAAAQASVAQALAGINRVKEELRYTELLSPITGTVTKLNAKVGEVVITGTMNNPGTVIMTVNDLSEMIVKAEVDETDIADIRIGQKARVHINAYPDDVFDAKVTKIALQRSKARDMSECFVVECLMDLKGRTLYSGLTGSVDIEVETVRDVLLAPSQAVLDRRVDELPREVTVDNPLVDKDKTFARVVYVMTDGKARAVPVKTGASDLRTTAVLAGIEPGTKIVTGPYKALLALKHDQKVRDEEVEKKEKEAKDAKAAQAKKDAEKKKSGDASKDAPATAGAQQASAEQKPAEGAPPADAGQPAQGQTASADKPKPADAPAQSTSGSSGSSNSNGATPSGGN